MRLLSEESCLGLRMKEEFFYCTKMTKMRNFTLMDAVNRDTSVLKSWSSLDFVLALYLNLFCNKKDISIFTYLTKKGFQNINDSNFIVVSLAIIAQERYTTLVEMIL